MAEARLAAVLAQRGEAVRHGSNTLLLSKGLVMEDEARVPKRVLLRDLADVLEVHSRRHLVKDLALTVLNQRPSTPNRTQSDVLCLRAVHGHALDDNHGQGVNVPDRRPALALTGVDVGSRAGLSALTAVADAPRRPAVGEGVVSTFFGDARAVQIRSRRGCSWGPPRARRRAPITAAPVCRSASGSSRRPRQGRPKSGSRPRRLAVAPLAGLKRNVMLRNKTSRSMNLTEQYTNGMSVRAPRPQPRDASKRNRLAVVLHAGLKNKRTPFSIGVEPNMKPFFKGYEFELGVYLDRYA